MKSAAWWACFIAAVATVPIEWVVLQDNTTVVANGTLSPVIPLAIQCKTNLRIKECDEFIERLRSEWRLIRHRVAPLAGRSPVGQEYTLFLLGNRVAAKLTTGTEDDSYRSFAFQDKCRELQCRAPLKCINVLDSFTRNHTARCESLVWIRRVPSGRLCRHDDGTGLFIHNNETNAYRRYCLESFRMVDLLRHLNNKWIHFSGDSTSRIIYMQLHKELFGGSKCRFRDPCIMYFNKTVKADHLRHVCQCRIQRQDLTDSTACGKARHGRHTFNIKVTYGWKESLASRSDQHLANIMVQRHGLLPDIWISNVGHHNYHVDGNSLSIDGIVEGAKRLAHDMELHYINSSIRSLSGKKCFLWRSSFRHSKDCNTYSNANIDLLNSIAKDIMIQRGFSVISDLISHIKSGDICDIHNVFHLRPIITMLGVAISNAC